MIEVICFLYMGSIDSRHCNKKKTQKTDELGTLRANSMQFEAKDCTIFQGLTEMQLIKKQD
jgi:hypothetical protein